MPAPSPRWIEQRLNGALASLREGRLFKAQRTVDEVLDRVPDHVVALRLAGDIARVDGRLDVALDRYIAAAKQDPSHLPTLDAIAQVAAASDRTGPAIQALELAVVSDPTDGSRQRRLSQGYFTAGKLQESLGHARLATMLAPDDAEAYGLMGANLLHLEEHNEALAALDRAITIDPGAAQAMVNAAIGLDALGRTEEATQLRERASALAPDDPLVAFITKDDSIAADGDPRLAALEQRLEDPLLAVEGRVLGGLALAKLWDDAGDTARAARHLIEANRLRAAQLERRGTAYDVTKTEALLQAMRRAFDADLLARAPQQRDGPVPIVLVGMPRAGKTLLEARLCDDPGVYAVGERPVITPVQQALEARTGAGVPQHLDRLTRVDLLEIGRILDEAVAAPPGTTAFVSASPGNTLAAGMFALLDARTIVVHCRRDPRDVLLSNYLQWFPMQNPWSWTVEGLVHQYRVVETYGEHWLQALAPRAVEVRYEELVADPSTVLDRVRAVAGLETARKRPAVNDADRVAASPTAKPDPSAPLHRAHVGLWRRWAPHLPELDAAIDAAQLGEHYEHLERSVLEQ